MAGDKTERATPKKRQDERKKGNVPQSKDVITTVTLFLSFYSIKYLFPLIYDRVSRYMQDFISRTATIKDLSLNVIGEISIEFTIACILTFVPIMLIVVSASVLTSGIQTRFLFTTKEIKFKLSRCSPLKGIKNMFSLKKVVDLLKGVLKISILIIIFYQFVKGTVYDFAKTMSMDLHSSSYYMLNSVIRLLNNILMAFVALSAFDFFYERWDYERQMKMSKQEIKDEYKQLEGNPEIKAKIRNIQTQRSRARMMQAVPLADVVIKNPTHYAVALRYDTEKDNAPVLIAKGQDELALRIIKVAEENKVVVMENKPLARALYASTEVNQEIPAEYYGTIAEILVYIYQLGKKDLKNRLK